MEVPAYAFMEDERASVKSVADLVFAIMEDIKASAKSVVVAEYALTEG